MQGIQATAGKFHAALGAPALFIIGGIDGILKWHFECHYRGIKVFSQRIRVITHVRITGAIGRVAMLGLEIGVDTR